MVHLTFAIIENSFQKKILEKMLLSFW